MTQFRTDNPSTTYRPAFVAVMVRQLVADGALGLDDLVADHAPEPTDRRRRHDPSAPRSLHGHP